MNLFFLLLCPLCFAFNSIALRLYQTKITDDPRTLPFFQAAFCLVASLLYATGIRAVPSLLPLLLGVAFGCCFFLCSFCSARCYLVGPMSLTSVLVNTSMLLPIFWSVLFYDDGFTGRMAVGIGLVLLTFVLSSRKQQGAQDKQEHRHTIWIVLVSIAFVSNGATAILQKVRQRAEPEGDLFVFLAISYLTATLLFYIRYCSSKRRDHTPAAVHVRRGLWWMLVIMAGAGTFLGNCLLQILCTRIAAGVLYPVVNGGLCLLVATASFVFFRERATLAKVCAIVAGVLGIILLSV